MVAITYAILFVNVCLAQESPYFARAPSGNTSRFVFEFNSHIWLQERGKSARRITSGDGEEASPVLSPDGRNVAFVGSDGLFTEVFTVLLATGEVTRLTYEGGYDAKVQGWLSNFEVLYSTGIKSKKRGPLLFAIDTATHIYKAVPLAEASEGCLANDSFIFVKNEKLIDNIRTYRGGYAQSILRIPAAILDEDASKPASPGVHAVPLTSSYPGVSRQPICLDDRIYFLSDRSGRFNIWSMQIDGADLKQHTFEKDYDIGSISSAGDGSILYEQLGNIFAISLASRKTEKVEIRIPKGAVSNIDLMTFNTSDATEFQISDDGKQALLVLRGNLWSVDVSSGTAKCLECTAAARVRSVRLDAESNLFALSDKGGEYKSLF